MNGVVHLSLPADCAASMGQRRTPPLFQDGFAVSAKWFHPAGFSACFAGFSGRLGFLTASGYRFRLKLPAGYRPGSTAPPRRKAAPPAERFTRTRPATT